MWKTQGETFGLYRWCSSVSQPNFWSHPSPYWQYGDGRNHTKGWFHTTTFQVVLTLWCVAAPKKRTTPLCSSLLGSFPNTGRTLYSTLTFRAIKKQLCGPVRFHYACLLSYRWQNRYLTTVLPAFARNVFYGGSSVFIWLSLIFYTFLAFVVSTQAQMFLFRYNNLA